MKIRKYSLHILILIIFVGLFTSVLGVQVQADAIQNFGSPFDSQNLNNPPSSTQNSSSNSSADVCSIVKGIGNIICKVNQILGSIIPVMVALGMVYFVWGVVQYIIGGGEEAKKKGREHIIYSLIGLAVIVGVWGLVNILVNTFGLGGANIPTLAGTSTGSCLIGTDLKTFQDVMVYVTCIIWNSVVPLIFALAIVMFIWGVVQYVINSDEEAKKEKGRQFMIWGIIALTVMVSVWGLVRVLGDTFGIDSTFIPQVKSTSQ